MLVTEAQKVVINLGYFLKKLCHQDFSKIAQSGHTAEDTQLGTSEGNEV